MPFTKESLYKMSTEDLKKAMADPKQAAEINEALKANPEVIQDVLTEIPAADPDPAGQTDAEAQAALVQAEAEKTEEQKAIEAKATEDKAVADKAIADKLEEDRKAALAAEAAKPKQKIIRDYQARDEHGTPIGRPTHLEADTWEEMADKLQTAHEHATRAFERLKARKITTKEAPKVTRLSEEEIQQAIKDAQKSDDPKKFQEAVTKIAKNENFESEERLRQKEAYAAQMAIGAQFVRNHIADYNNNEANNKLMGDFLTDNNYEFTLDNLEFAFIQLSDQLAPVNKPVSVPATQSVAQVPPTPAPVAQPAAQVPAQQPAAVNPPVVVVKRPGVNAGIVPGSSSAGRPTPVAAGPTLEEVKRMPAAEFKMKLKKDPKFGPYVERLYAAAAASKAS